MNSVELTVWHEQCGINSVEDVATLRIVPDALDLLCPST